jgi:hypothetical protein
MRKYWCSAKWQLTPEDLAKALSRKTLKSTSQPLRPDEIDDISRYNLDIDLISDHLLTKAAHSLEEFTPTRSKQERKHLETLNNYLNHCLDHCRALFPLVAQSDCYHHKLRFYTYDREVKDDIINAPPLRPHLVGAHSPLFNDDRVSWAPNVSERNQTLFIPVEVKENFDELLVQAFLDAMGLFSASPLRQFGLVLGYNQRTHELRFLVYHSGGVSINEPLSLTNRSHKKEIIRLFLSILTWKTDGDAGLPEWFKGTMMRLPGHAEDDQGLLVELSKVLSNTCYIRGRSQMVYRCRVVKGQTEHQKPGSLAPITSRGQSRLRRSERIAHKAAGLSASKSKKGE